MINNVFLKNPMLTYGVAPVAPASTGTTGNPVIYSAPVRIGYGTIKLFSWTTRLSYRKRKIMADAYINTYLPDLYAFTNHGIAGNFLNSDARASFIAYIAAFPNDAAFRNAATAAIAHYSQWAANN